MTLSAETTHFRKWSRSRVQVAITNGSLVRMPCVECGSEPAEAHHGNGYENALDVTWLCRSHHRVLHAKATKVGERLLRELYVERRHSQQEIAQALGVHRMTVADWLREYGITRDDRPAVSL